MPVPCDIESDEDPICDFERETSADSKVAGISLFCTDEVLDFESGCSVLMENYLLTNVVWLNCLFEE